MTGLVYRTPPQAQAATLRRIGQGGLNEEAAEGLPNLAALPGGGRRQAGGENVSTVDVVRHPSEAEQVLRMLPAHLRALRRLPPAAGTQRLCPATSLA